MRRPPPIVGSLSKTGDACVAPGMDAAVKRILRWSFRSAQTEPVFHTGGPRCEAGRLHHARPVARIGRRSVGRCGKPAVDLPCWWVGLERALRRRSVWYPRIELPPHGRGSSGESSFYKSRIWTRGPVARGVLEGFSCRASPVLHRCLVGCVRPPGWDRPLFVQALRRRRGRSLSFSSRKSAQTKPASSRATAVAATVEFLRIRSASKRRQSLRCARRA